jgi:hypothetical protein
MLGYDRCVSSSVASQIPAGRHAMKGLLLSAVVCSLTACTSTRFTKTGFESAPPRSPDPCSVTVLQRPPSDRQYGELGFCTTSMAGGVVIVVARKEGSLLMLFLV